MKRQRFTAMVDGEDDFMEEYGMEDEGKEWRRVEGQVLELRELEFLANLLCEVARFDLHYPLALGVERVGPLLESAVGDSSDTSPTVGGVASTLGPDDPLAAAAVERTAVINGGHVTHQPSPRGPQGQPSPLGGVAAQQRPHRRVPVERADVPGCQRRTGAGSAGAAGQRASGRRKRVGAGAPFTA